MPIRWTMEEEIIICMVKKSWLPPLGSTRLGSSSCAGVGHFRSVRHLREDKRKKNPYVNVIFI